ncbi:MAG: hypothetical protein A4E30_01222 [Methanomassiliicoccales archaeon PtaB.Bin215]|mgnify:CR=1 FL=1|nr:MAG: hypothetical protein A4E30_01222 [Methanomassiliicoccales archaeon PtaB.Bin215]
MKQKERIVLEKEKREEMVKAIMYYFKQEREEDIGQLAAGMVLDFVIEKLAPEFYNQGVLDSCAYMDEKVEDMQSLLL